jgi:hypothetical protein
VVNSELPEINEGDPAVSDTSGGPGSSPLDQGLHRIAASILSPTTQNGGEA